MSEIKINSNGENGNPPIQKIIEPKKQNRIYFYLKNIFAVLFWVYSIIKVFIFDIDIYFIEKVNSKYTWLINYKFLLFLGIISALWIITRKSKIVYWGLYILFFPFILVFWIIPKTVYKIGSWNFGIGTINAFLSFFKSFKYNFITFSGFIISSVIILNFNNKIVLWTSLLLIIVILIIIFVNRVILVFKPSFIYKIYSILLNKFLSSSKSTWTINTEIKELERAEMTEGQLQTWTTNLQFAIIVNKSCYLLSSKLKGYQRSGINLIFNALSVVLLFLITIICFALINMALYKINPDYFRLVTVKPDFFEFFYYSFNCLCFNSINEIISISNTTRLFSMIEQSFALLLGAVFITLFLSIKTERESKDIDDIISKIKEQGDNMESFIQTEYKLTIGDAITELERLKAGMIKIIFYLTKNIS